MRDVPESAASGRKVGPIVGSGARLGERIRSAGAPRRDPARRGTLAARVLWQLPSAIADLNLERL